jgi:hypothetical protein
MKILPSVAVIVGLVFLGTWGWQWIRAPWSLEILGPTLTGTWEGPLQARLGAEYRAYLDMGYQEDIESRFNLTGRALICSRHGDLYEYTLDGEASRSGDRVTIQLAYVDPVRSALGNSLEGTWHGETLTLRPVTNPFMPDGTFQLHRAVSTADPDDSFAPAELRRADLASYLAACGRLAG